VVDRLWKEGDTVNLDLPMEVGVPGSQPRVRATFGKVAVAHGPLVYWAEQVDNGAQFNGLALGSASLARREKNNVVVDLCVLVVSPAEFNEATKVPVICPNTSVGTFAKRLGFAVPLHGITTTGVVRCDQPREKSRYPANAHYGRGTGKARSHL